MKGIAGSIYVGQLLGANQPAEAINALRVFMTIACTNKFVCRSFNISKFTYKLFIGAYAMFDFVLILSLSNYLPYAFGNNMYKHFFYIQIQNIKLF